MKYNYLKVFFSTIVVFAFFMPICLSSIVFASEFSAYTIKSISINSEINPDGSLDVHEKFKIIINPDFDDAFLRQIDLSNASEISNLNVSISYTEDKDQISTNVIPIEFTESRLRNQTGIYTTHLIQHNNSNLLSLNIYPPLTREMMILYVEYTLHDFAYLYNDVTLLRWSIKPTDYENSAKDVNVNIKFPLNIPYEDIKVIANGSLSIDNLKIDNNSVSFSIAEIGIGDYLDTFIQLPVQSLPQARKIIDNYINNELIKLQQYLSLQKMDTEIKVEQQRINITRAGLFLIFCGLGIGSYFLATFLRKATKAKLCETKDIHEDCNQLNDITDLSYSPVELSIIFNKANITKRDLIATLMDLVLKRCFYLSTELSDDIRTLKFTLNREFNTANLRSFEEYLVNWLLLDAGKDLSFTLSDIKNASDNKSSMKIFANKFDTWKRIFFKFESTLYITGSKPGKICELTSYGQAEYNYWQHVYKLLKLQDKTNFNLSINDFERYLIYLMIIGESYTDVQYMISQYGEELFDDESLTILRRENLELLHYWYDLSGPAFK